MLEFIGHFHPLIVHLPIGILVLVLVMEVLIRWQKPRFGTLAPALDLAWLSTAISGAISCMCGYFLSLADSYDDVILSRHQWMGIVLTLWAGGFWYVRQEMAKQARFQIQAFPKIYDAALVGAALLLMATGHLGGSLTHGEGYLSQPFFAMLGISDEAKRQPIANIEEAKVYEDVIVPVFEKKCYSCHSAKKQKGDLRLDAPNYILQGGETGEVITKGDAMDSEVIKRAHLDINHEDKMPPKGKPQLSNTEIALVHWWIQQGAPFDKQVKQLQKTSEASKALATLQKGESNKNVWANADVPQAKVSAANLQEVKKLRDKGILVLPVANGSPFLSLNFVNATNLTDQDFRQLQPTFQALAPQIAWLKLSHTKITDAGLATFAQLPNVTRLFLTGTSISDKGISQIQQMPSLHYLNLMQTQVSDQGVAQLSQLKNLKALYVYQSKMTRAGVQSLKNALPKCNVNFGEYDLPFLVTDTLHFKDKPKTE